MARRIRARAVVLTWTPPLHWRGLDEGGEEIHPRKGGCGDELRHFGAMEAVNLSTNPVADLYLTRNLERRMGKSFES